MTVRAHAMFSTFDPTSNAVITAATVNIYNPGTVTPISATIFDRLGNPLSNPLTSDATTGLVDFYLTVAQEVDVVVSKTGFTTRTYSNVPVLDDSSLELTALLTTTGDTVYASSANTPVRLPIGSNNTVLNVTGGVPKWTSALQVSDANGNASVGTTVAAGTGLTVASTTLTGTTQLGINSNQIFSSGATTAGVGIQSLLTTAAASFTMTNAYTFLAQSPTIGASSAVTNQYGYYAANQGASGITNAYGVYIAAQSGAATTNIGLFNNGTTTLAGTVSVTSGNIALSGGGYLQITHGTQAGAGDIRLDNTKTIDWRNAANNNDDSIAFDSSDRFAVVGIANASSATAGGNGATPAQVAFYWTVSVNGTQGKIPVYNV